MKITVLIGSLFGTKTRIAGDYLLRQLEEKYPETTVNLLDLTNYNLVFSDGRNYLDYPGDTGKVAQQLMDSDAIFILTPIYQASIPGSLKNVFDILPVRAFRNKVVAIAVVAGSEKHYLTIEQQLKPILAFMKAEIVQSYVFMLDTDFAGGEIANDEVIFRLNRLVDETLTTSRVYQEIQAENEAKYDF